MGCDAVLSPGILDSWNELTGYFNMHLIRWEVITHAGIRNVDIMNGFTMYDPLGSEMLHTVLTFAIEARVRTPVFIFLLNPCIYSMLLNILPCALCTSPLSVQALQSRSYICYVSYATTAA
jgi:hypothetical protein